MHTRFTPLAGALLGLCISLATHPATAAEGATGTARALGLNIAAGAWTAYWVAWASRPG